ncbi:carcinoembryonic antigen-related cell adhesion molecule 2-like isoform X2 [Poeciliopsis prolifica]|uniref:carcinoembryonic antigen-related cell adhesion molecule 2-like isoform X2 n=1 Tax=Poeciliopsis prolifica TaxID=188132 RepID=UPI002413F075|nr:carcinoembryonic antigen-related cell adhesion molecule 2-like isoform X2 [Poeciliopsis prolifica]
MEPLYIHLLLLCKVLNVLNTLDIIQDSGVRTAKAGETVTLPCSCQHNAITYLYWYYQIQGEKPRIISKRMKHDPEADISPAYKERFRVLVKPNAGVNDLMIMDLQPSDSGTYYCAMLEFSAIEFGRGVFLHVKTSSSNAQPSKQQPTLKKVLRLGDSVNLSCSVSAEPCEGERNLYWFRRTASQPPLMYPSEGLCTSLSNGTLYGINCISSLELDPVRSSDAGTYHCALASCGSVVFGGGTKVEISVPSVVLGSLSVALVLSTIGLLVLSFLRYKLKSKLCSSCKGTGKHRMCCEARDGAQENQTESLHYAALKLKRSVERQQQEDNVESACVYSRVRSRKE